MTGPKPNGPSHPRPTHPPKLAGVEQHHTGIGEPNEHSRPISILPNVGMMVRDCERLGAQLLAILNRDLDPASLPPEGLDFYKLVALREVAGYHAEQVLKYVGDIADLPLPAVGSVPKFPARQDPASGSVATPGAPVRPTPAKGEEPTSGSAAALLGAARKSTGAVVAPGAGADPSPSAAPVAPGRGVGPGFLGPLHAHHRREAS